MFKKHASEDDHKEIPMKFNATGDAIIEEVGVGLFEKALDTFPDAIAHFVPSGIDTLIGHGIGVVSPRAGSVYLGWRVSRANTNIDVLRTEVRGLSERLSLLELKVQKKNPQWIKDSQDIHEITLDAVIDERVIEKIKYYALGLYKALTEEQLDPIRHEYFVSLLKQCTNTDLLVLFAAYDHGSSIIVGPVRDSFMKESGLTEDLLALAIGHLRNLGLFDDGSQDAIQRVIKRIAEQEQAVARGRSVMSFRKPVPMWNKLSNLGIHFVMYFRDWITNEVQSE